MSEKFEYRGMTYEVNGDEHSESPRVQWDNLGTVLIFGRYECMGDTHTHPLKTTDYRGWNELEQAVRKAYNPVVILPIYGYSHGGMTIATTPFSCPWDSGQLGFILVERHKMEEWNGWKRATSKRRERLIEMLEQEVRELDQYITGEVYEFLIEKEEDACWHCGYYGWEHTHDSAHAEIDYILDNK